MKTIKTWSTTYRNVLLLSIIFLLSVFLNKGFAQTNETLASGACIINMGVTPQTVGNGLKPYGLIYELIRYHGVPVKWIINGTKAKDGTDFTYGGTAYKGGPFIIPAEYMSTDVIAEINKAKWSTVIRTITTAPVTVPVAVELQAVPTWTLDAGNGRIAEGYIENAGINETGDSDGNSITRENYNWVTPQNLGPCNDIFAMPHADPKWETHRNLLAWNNTYKGAIWLACNAGSALENMFDNITTDGDPIDRTEQTNFLSKKTNNAVGGGPWSDPGNSILLWGDHDNGTLPYSYQYPTDPFMQFLGTIDAATQKGSEQIYIPVGDNSGNNAGWRPGAKVYVYDPDHPDAVPATSTPLEQVAAVVVSGRGFDDANRGRVMLEAGHTVDGTAPTNIAAQRIFFNFTFFAANEKAVIPQITGLPDNVFSGQTQALSITLPAGANAADYTVTWSTSCGGSFSPNGQTGQLSTTFTPPTVTDDTPCFITVQIQDACGRKFIDKEPTIVGCEVVFTVSGTKPSCNGGNDGVIAVAVSSGVADYTYDWTRTEGGSGSGTGIGNNFNITGLAAGTYTIEITDNGGTGCSSEKTFSLGQPALLNLTGSSAASLCGGASGSINLTVTGGTPPYSFSWTGGSTDEDISNIGPGNYTVDVADAKGCTAQETFTVGGPTAITNGGTVTDVKCKGDATGEININVSGGDGSFTYLWGDGSADEDRTGLVAGTYEVTATDGNNCSQTFSIDVDEPTAELSLSETHVDVLCEGTLTGSIDLTVTGGTSTYSFAWTTTGGTIPAGQEDDEDLDLISSGDYSVTVTDNNLCTEVLNVTIDETSGIEIVSTPTHPTCPPDADQNGADGAIAITVTGGVPGPGYTYSWTTTGGTIPTGQEDDKDLTDLTAGTYQLTVTDSNGCAATATIILNYLNPNPVKPPSIENN